MSSISPPSSPLVLSSSPPVGSSKSHSQGFHPQTPKLPYKTVNFVASEPPVPRTYQRNNDIFCPSSPIAPSDGLNALLQTACNEAEYNEEFEEENTAETAAESNANRAFLEEDLNSKLNESETTSSDSDDSKGDEFPAALSLDTMPYLNNNWLNDCSEVKAYSNLERRGFCTKTMLRPRENASYPGLS